MYPFIRQLHLFSSLILSVFVLMYFVTGLVMIFEEEFKRENEEVNIRDAFIKPPILNEESLVDQLQQKYDLEGQYNIQMQEQQAIVNFGHPGTTARAVISFDVDSVFIVKRKGNFVNILHQFHRLHGYHGGFNYYTWALAYDLSALSMIVFALSGLYLWFKSEREKITGWVLFIASTCLTAATIIYFMFIA